MQQALPQPHAGAAREHGGDGGGLEDDRYHAPDEDDGQGELGNALLVHVGGQKAREQRPGDAHHGRHGEDHLDGGARHVGIGFAQHGQDGRERREDAVVNGEAEDGDQEQRVLDPEITDEPAQRFSHDCPLRIGCGGRQSGAPASSATRPPSPAANRCDMIVWGPRFVLIPRGLIWPFGAWREKPTPDRRTLAVRYVQVEPTGGRRPPRVPGVRGDCRKSRCGRHARQGLIRGHT